MRAVTAKGFSFETLFRLKERLGSPRLLRGSVSRLIDVRAAGIVEGSRMVLSSRPWLSRIRWVSLERASTRTSGQVTP